MKLTNFKLAGDNIAFEQNENYYDIHNNFDFISFNYSLAKREIVLNWVKGTGNWVPNNSPKSIHLIIRGISLFKAKERDTDMPFTEDDCLSSIGFLWNDMIEEMGGYHSHEPKENCTHLSIEFMSGLALKIGADSALLKVIDKD